MKKKNVISLLLIFAVVFSFCIPEAAAVGSMDSFKPVKSYKNNFKDVSANAWYYEYVKICYEYGLVIGTSDTTYSPQSNLTVAELIAEACRIHCIYSNGSNTLDKNGSVTSNPWYSIYVDYAVKEGLIGKNDFTANEYAKPATRATMIHIFYGVLSESEFPVYNDINSIPDMKPADKYYDEILSFYRTGIVRGMDSVGTFAPDSTCTRAEAATMFALIIIPSLRNGYKPTPAMKSYSHKINSTTLSFNAPGDYTESDLYGKTVLRSASAGITVSMDALRDSAFSDTSITSLFTDEEIIEFFEIDFSQLSESYTVTSCVAQPMSYGTVAAYQIKSELTGKSGKLYYVTVMFITDSTLFEVAFTGASDSAALAKMVESFTVNGHNMYAK